MEQWRQRRVAEVERRQLESSGSASQSVASYLHFVLRELARLKSSLKKIKFAVLC